MFSSISANGQISGRQMKRLLLFDMIGITTLLLPQTLAADSGIDGVFAIAVGTGLTILYLKILDMLGRGRAGEFWTIVNLEKYSKLAGVLLLFYLLFFLILAGYVTWLVSGMIQRTLLKEESFWLIAISMILLSGYGIQMGIEGRARIFELLYWLLFLPFFLMLLLASRDVNVDYWSPVFYGDGWKFVKSVAVTCIYLHIGTLVFFTGGVNTSLCKKARQAVAIVGVWNVAVYLILIGIFQSKLVATQEYSTVVLMSMIKIPGGFLKRQDAYMVAFWFFSLYALLNSMLYQGTRVLQKIVGVRGNKRYILVSMLAVIGITVLFYQNLIWRSWFQTYFGWAVLVSAIIVPAVMGWTKGGEKKDGKNIQKQGRL